MIKNVVVGDKVEISLNDFKELVTNYQTLKAENTELKKANDYLNNEIKKYNKEFTDDNKKRH